MGNLTGDNSKYFYDSSKALFLGYAIFYILSIALTITISNTEPTFYLNIINIIGVVCSHILFIGLFISRAYDYSVFNFLDKDSIDAYMIYLGFATSVGFVLAGQYIYIVYV